MPLAFIPPKGAGRSRAFSEFTQIIPACRSSVIRIARLRSFVHRYAASPYCRSLASASAFAHKGDRLGGVGTTVLWEDERVKIWEMVLAPGEASDLHRHDHDYYLVIMEGDLVAGVTPEGSGVDSFVGKVPENGNTVAIPKGGIEWAYNVGEKTYREILIELKSS